MPNLSLGTIEVLGLPAAVEAADVALKSADVTLIGYETTDGMGMVAVKIEGQVSAVQSAVAAARAAAERISKVFATSVIARPSEQLDPVVRTELTVGLELPAPAEPVQPVAVEAAAEVVVVPEPAEDVAEPAEPAEAVEVVEPEKPTAAPAPQKPPAPHATRNRKSSSQSRARK